MKIPEGYKQTEVGVIPKDWEVKVIGDIADVKTGPFGSALHESDYVIDGTPIITVEHLGDLGVEHFNLPMVSDKDRSRLKAYALKEGDVVFSRVGSIDRNALIRKLEDGWLFSGRLLRVRVNSLKDYPHYLSYHFHSEPFKQRVREVAVGQTMPSLNTQLLKGVQVVLPTPEEQRAIAQALSDVDALIAALDKLIAKKRHLKTATMQQLLTGKKRLPGFGEGKGYKQTEVGVIPEDWEVCCLDLISKLSSGTTPSRSQEDRYYRNGEHHWVKTTDLNNSRITTTEEKVTQAALDETCLQIYPPGTVFVAMYGGFNQIGRTGLLEIPAAVNQALIAIQPKANQLSSAYLLATLNYRVEHWKSVASSSRKDPNITSQDVKDFVLPLPDIEEQRAIATVLSDMDAEISALEARRAKTQAIKQGMMQELLTGRTRLTINP